MFFKAEAIDNHCDRFYQRQFKYPLFELLENGPDYSTFRPSHIRFGEPCHCKARLVLVCCDDCYHTFQREEDDDALFCVHKKVHTPCMINENLIFLQPK